MRVPMILNRGPLRCTGHSAAYVVLPAYAYGDLNYRKHWWLTDDDMGMGTALLHLFSEEFTQVVNARWRLLCAYL